MKSALFFAVFAIATTALAQDGSNKAVIGGTLTHSRQSYSTYTPTSSYYQEVKSRRTGISPYVGFLPSPQILLGLQGSISFLKEDVKITGISEKVIHDGYEYGFGGFLRYYFKLHDDFRLFLETGVTYFTANNKSSNEQVSFGSTKSYHATKAYLSPGISWSITKRLNLVGIFGQAAFVSGKRLPYYVSNEVPFHYFDFRLRGRGLRLGAEIKI